MIEYLPYIITAASILVTYFFIWGVHNHGFNLGIDRGQEIERVERRNKRREIATAYRPVVFGKKES
jgi:hypothetical protein